MPTNKVTLYLQGDLDETESIDFYCSETLSTDLKGDRTTGSGSDIDEGFFDKPARRRQSRIQCISPPTQLSL